MDEILEVLRKIRIILIAHIESEEVLDRLESLFEELFALIKKEKRDE